jgi:hypothetical protein
MNETESFADLFTSHERTLCILYDTQDRRGKPISVETLHFREKGHYLMRCLEFTLINERHLHVAGDYGNAVYSWSDQVDLEWIARKDFGYFHNKCRASPVGSEFLSWDGDIARERIVQFIPKSIITDKWCKRFDKAVGTQAIKGKSRWGAWLQRRYAHNEDEAMGNGITNCEEFFHTYEASTPLRNIGDIPHVWSRIHHAGLRAAFNITP